jgi:hypothetical protein
MPDPTNPTAPASTSGGNSEVKSILNVVKKLVQPYFTHASGQALAWYTIATHDLSKWESGVAAAGTLVVTSAVKKITAWLSN